MKGDKEGPAREGSWWEATLEAIKPIELELFNLAKVLTTAEHGYLFAFPLCLSRRMYEG